MKAVFLFWMLYLNYLSYYFFSAGSVQICDVFGILFIFGSLSKIASMFGKYSFLKTMLFFVIYTFIVNSIWVLIIENTTLLKSSFNYLYAFLLLCSVIVNFDDKRFLKITFYAVVLSFITQIATMPFVVN